MDNNNQINSDFSITKLFLTKKLTVSVNSQFFVINAPTVIDLYTDNDLNLAYSLWTRNIKDLAAQLKLEIKDPLEVNTILIFKLGYYKQYSKLADALRRAFEKFFEHCEFDFQAKQIKINNVILTREIWDYVIYLLKLICGEKVNLPLTFNSEEERALYMAQQEAEDRIRKLRQQGSDREGLIKMFLSITYAFPSLTFDFLSHQTMAQIQWLQKYAAGSLSYEVNAQAFAAGNMKKGSKLDFFIK